MNVSVFQFQEVVPHLQIQEPELSIIQMTPVGAGKHLPPLQAKATASHRGKNVIVLDDLQILVKGLLLSQPKNIEMQFSTFLYLYEIKWDVSDIVLGKHIGFLCNSYSNNWALV